MATCRYCGEAIEFVETPKGRRMPVDPEVDLRLLLPGVTVVTPEGEVLRGSRETSAVRVLGHAPHWASCPGAGQAKGR